MLLLGPVVIFEMQDFVNVWEINLDFGAFQSHLAQLKFKKFTFARLFELIQLSFENGRLELPANWDQSETVGIIFSYAISDDLDVDGEFSLSRKFLRFGFCDLVFVWL